MMKMIKKKGDLMKAAQSDESEEIEDDK